MEFPSTDQHQLSIVWVVIVFFKAEVDFHWYSEIWDIELSVIEILKLSDFSVHSEVQMGFF